MMAEPLAGVSAQAGAQALTSTIQVTQPIEMHTHPPTHRILAAQTLTHILLVTQLPERTSRNCHLGGKEVMDVGSTPRVTEDTGRMGRE